ncbi:MAG: MoaD/ThiS family protein [Anaerolineales bacterium]
MEISVELVGFPREFEVPKELEDGEDLQVPEDATVENVLQRLELAHKNLLPVVNGKLSSHSIVLHDGDSVRFVAPMGGG